MTRYRFSAPPNWPTPPSTSWSPQPGWIPDPKWPPPPIGWRFWTPSPDDLAGTTEPQWRFQPRRVDGRGYAVFSIVLAAADLTLLIGAAGWTVTTSVLGHGLLGSNEFLIFFLPLFPVFGGAAWTLHALGKRRISARSRRASPAPGEVAGSLTERAWALVAVGAGAVATTLLAAAASGTLVPPDGQPTYNHDLHRYELNDHGSFTVVTKAAYDHGVVSSGHLFTLVASVFLIVALPVHLGRWWRWRAVVAGRPLPVPMRYDRVELAEGRAVRPTGDGWPAQLRADVDGLELRRVPDRLYRLFAQSQEALPSPPQWSATWTTIEYVERDARTCTLRIRLRVGSEVEFGAKREVEYTQMCQLLDELRVPVAR